MRKSAVVSLYALDLGNGFAKRKFKEGEAVAVDSSVIAEVPVGYNTSQLSTYSLNKTDDFYLGNDVLKTRLHPLRAMTVDRAERYFTDRYELMLYAFIAKDFPNARTITIPVLGLMLPNEHYAINEVKLIQKYKGSKVITVSGVDVTIKVEEVIVLPQPLGTYMYALKEKKIERGDEVLICDGGAGTFDPAVVINSAVTDDNYSNEGVDVAYVEIRKHLIERFGEMKYFKSLSNIPLILEHGVVKDGQIISVAKDKKIAKVLDDHLKRLFEYLLDNQYNIMDYDKVIWTGGVAPLHAERLKKYPNQNFVVLEKEGQEANVLGLWSLIKAYRNKGGASDGVESNSNED
jgi:plasmid segregation protein ParM